MRKFARTCVVAKRKTRRLLRRGSTMVDYLMITIAVTAVAVPIMNSMFGDKILGTFTSNRSKMVTFLAQSPHRTVPNTWFSNERMPGNVGGNGDVGSGNGNVGSGGGDVGSGGGNVGSGGGSVGGNGSVGNGGGNVGSGGGNVGGNGSVGNGGGNVGSGGGNVGGGGGGNVGGNGNAGGGGGSGGGGGGNGGLSDGFFGGGGDKGNDKKDSAPPTVGESSSGYGKSSGGSGSSGGGASSESGDGFKRSGGGDSKGGDQPNNKDGGAESRRTQMASIEKAEEVEAARKGAFDWWLVLKLLIIALILFLLTLIALSNLKRGR